MQILPPSLHNVSTTDYFKSWVKIPDDEDILHIWFKGDLIETELILIKLVSI
jgi:hypothetical protein